MKFTNILPFAFFISCLIIGLTIYDDYGINWDEESQRINNGFITYDFLTTGDTTEYADSGEKYHGPAFEVFLIAMEQVFLPETEREIYLMRHLFTFLTFFVGIIFFYFLAKDQLKSKWLALVGCLFLFLSPRLLGDAFHNSKDIPFLTFFIIALYTHHLYIKNPLIKTALIHGIACGFLIANRITGVLLPSVTLGILILILLFPTLRVPRKKTVITIPVFIAGTIGFTILCWPILWLGPVHHFIAAWEEMSHYEWIGSVTFMGEVILAKALPWNYIPVWFIITTPLQYLLLFSTGTAFFIKNIFSFTKSKIAEYYPMLVNFILLLTPVLAVIFLNSVIYDAWRHLFFIYIPFLLILLYGIKELLGAFSKNKFLHYGTIAFIAATSLITARTMILQHPFQYVYFNKLAGDNLKEIRFKYELDYWGVSYKQLYEKITPTITEHVKIYPENLPAKLNTYMLTDGNQQKLRITFNRDKADYLVTNFRFTNKDTVPGSRVDLMLEGAPLSSAFRINLK